MMTNCQLFSDAPPVLWTVEFDGRVESLAMDSDGILYLTGNSSLYAVNTDGNLLWKSELDEYILSIPVIGSNGRIYLTTSEGHLLEIDQNGNILNSFSLGFSATRLAIDMEGNIFCISIQNLGYSGGSLLALNPDGSTKWNKFLDLYLKDVKVGTDGTIYAACNDSIYTFNPDGSQKWRYPIETPSFLWWTEIAIGNDNSIYFVAGDLDRCIYSLSSDGSLKWKQPTGEDLVNSPVIDSDGLLYFTSWFGGLHALKPNGTEKWTKDIDGPVDSDPVIDSDGTIYFGDGKGILHAVDASGEELWTFKTEGKYKFPEKDKDIYESPIIGNDGTIYFISYYYDQEGTKTYLYALKGFSSGLADSPWPRVHHDNRNTSSAASP